MVPLILAFVIGFVSGLRTFTPLAALALVLGSMVWKVLAVLAALVEYVVDALPAAPSRTRPVGVAARAIAGGVAGWIVAAHLGGSAAAGAALGVAGAVAGAYAGFAARIAAIPRIGAIPAALAEDLVAIALAALIVTR